RADAAQYGARARPCTPCQCPDVDIALVGRTARARTAAGADVAAAGRCWLPGDLMGRGVEDRRRGPARDRSEANRLLSHLARHYQRNLLRGAEGGAISRDQPRRQLGAALSRSVDLGDEVDAGARRLVVQLQRLDWRRPDRVLWRQHAKQ